MTDQWDLEGMWVDGAYLGEFTVSGKVLNSRVKYGGGVQHLILLDNPIEVYGRFCDKGELLFLEHEYVTRVKDLP